MGFLLYYPPCLPLTSAFLPCHVSLLWEAVGIRSVDMGGPGIYTRFCLPVGYLPSVSVYLQGVILYLLLC
jgi:hypothetical protein